MNTTPQTPHKSLLLGASFPTCATPFLQELKQQMQAEAEHLAMTLLFYEADSVEQQRLDIQDCMAESADGLVIYPVSDDFESLGVESSADTYPQELDTSHENPDLAAKYAREAIRYLVRLIESRNMLPFEIVPPASAPTEKSDTVTTRRIDNTLFLTPKNSVPSHPAKASPRKRKNQNS